MKKITEQMDKVTNNKAAKTLGKGVSEFRDFIAKGNVVDLAVGVIIGAAFGNIVSSLVNDILMPVIGILIGGVDFSGLSINIADAKIMYGSFIQQIIDFLIIALCVFIFVKIISKISFSKEETAEEEIAEEEAKEVVLLEEIRDLLKENKENNDKK